MVTWSAKYRVLHQDEAGPSQSSTSVPWFCACEGATLLSEDMHVTNGDEQGDGLYHGTACSPGSSSPQGWSSVVLI